VCEAGAQTPHFLAGAVPSRPSCDASARAAAAAPAVPCQAPRAPQRRLSDLTCSENGSLDESNSGNDCGGSSFYGAATLAAAPRLACSAADAAAARGAALALLLPGGLLLQRKTSLSGDRALIVPAALLAPSGAPPARRHSDELDSDLSDSSPAALRRSFSCSTMDPLFPGAGAARARRASSFLLAQLEAPCTPPRGLGAEAAADDAVELCCRLSRARQTVDFVHRQRARHCSLSKARLSLWDALLLLADVPPIAAALAAGAPGAPPVHHLAASVAAAEAARAAHPSQPWLAFVALTHALGRLLLLPRFGGEPAWACVGETFPVGCRFDPSVSYAACFGANPDRRKRAYASPTGVYAPGCGLAEVDMCWSGDEYLLEVLARNRAALPSEGLFCIRYGSFAALGGAAVGYNALLTPAERGALPWLGALRALKREAAADAPAQHADGRAALLALEHVYRPLLDQFCPGELRW
jgi:inositol oxygenase